MADMKLSLWLRAGVVGAGLATIGIAQLISHEIRSGTALALVVIGGFLIARARRAWRSSGDPLAGHAPKHTARIGSNPNATVSPT